MMTLACVIHDLIRSIRSISNRIEPFDSRAIRLLNYAIRSNRVDWILCGDISKRLQSNEIKSNRAQGCLGVPSLGEAHSILKPDIDRSLRSY